MTSVLLVLISLYQRTISPFLSPRCRFFPSCSTYAYDAISTHGQWSGSWLTLKRLSKCHPLHPGGVDLVPRKDIL